MKKRLALTATFLVALSGGAEEAAREPGSFIGDGCVLDLETPLCENCLDFAHVTRLGGDELGPGFLVAEGTMDNVVRDSLGNYWVGQDEQIKVFDAEGTFLRAIGRRGDGPMEFGSAAPTHTDGSGRVHVFDTDNLRISVIDEAFTLVEEKRLPTWISAKAPLSDGERYVVHASIEEPGRVGMPLHIIDDSGILRSFGAGDERNSDSPESMPVELTLAADADGSVFAARRFEYVVEVWSQEGSRLGGLRGEPLLNSANFLLEPASPDNPPPNIIGQIRTDPDGLLWVSLAARRTDWLETRIPHPSGDGFIEPALEDITGIFQGRLDVIDLSTCTLVASRLHDPMLVLLDDRTVLGYGFTELGAHTLDVLRVWLHR